MTLKKTRNLFKKYYNELKLLKGPGYFEAEETREFTVYRYSLHRDSSYQRLYIVRNKILLHFY